MMKFSLCVLIEIQKLVLQSVRLRNSPYIRVQMEVWTGKRFSTVNKVQHKVLSHADLFG